MMWGWITAVIHPLAYLISRLFDPAVTKILTRIAFLLLVPEILLMQAWFALFGILNVSITYFWKISGHMMAATGLVMWLSLLWSPIFLLLLITFIPLVAWSRLSMRKHTLAQVMAGTCLMVMIVLAIWLLFPVW